MTVVDAKKKIRIHAGFAIIIFMTRELKMKVHAGSAALCG